MHVQSGRKKASALGGLILEGRRRAGSPARGQRAERGPAAAPTLTHAVLLPRTVRPPGRRSVSPPSLPRRALAARPGSLLCLLLLRASRLGAGHGAWGAWGSRGRRWGSDGGKGEKGDTRCPWSWRGGADGTARGMSMVGRAGSRLPSQPTRAPGSAPLRPPPGWARGCADKDFPFGVCPLLVPRPHWFPL